jgi:hypothetical protein
MPLKGGQSFSKAEVATQKLHFRLFTHCAIQAACTQSDEPTRRAITHGGAVAGFTNTIADYDFQKTYTTLESAYRGQYSFDSRVANLTNPTSQLSFLPNPNIGVVNAKYLIEAFVIPNLNNSKAFIDQFESYSMTMVPQSPWCKRPLLTFPLLSKLHNL